MTRTSQRQIDQPAVEIHGLRKTFGRTVALDGLDLTVARGDISGFLGPNGAGKSTTLRVLLGLLRAEGGTVELLGGDPWRDAVTLHRRIAYVPGDVTLWPNLTGGQAIDFLAGLRGGVDERRRDELIQRFELDPHKKARTYSKGNMSAASGNGLGAGIALGQPGTALRLSVAGLAYVPATAVIAGVAALAVAVRRPWIGWLAVTYVVTSLYLGELLRLPRWLIDASPVGRTTAPAHVPVTALVVMVLVAVALTGAAGVIYRDRDAL
jgi:ABC-type branched-subunit amino acid transport system ATPase component